MSGPVSSVGGPTTKSTKVDSSWKLQPIVLPPKIYTANMGRLEGKNSIITGAAGGIGLETSILFAQNGANVLMSDINAEQLDKAVARVKELAPNAKVEGFVRFSPIIVITIPPLLICFWGQVCDVSKEAEVEEMVKKTDAWGGLDVIFNNAGIMHAKVRRPPALPHSSS
jgi:NAD(P)-dependent dehydrogenase (short-subunit alcohol dehydrogenase family)